MKPYVLLFAVLFATGCSSRSGLWSTQPALNGEIELRLLPNHTFECFETEFAQSKPFYDTYTRGEWSEKGGAVELHQHERRMIRGGCSEVAQGWTTCLLNPKGSVLTWPDGRTIDQTKKTPVGMTWDAMIKEFPPR